MSISSDPFVHRQREQEVVRHVERLLDDERLRVDTTMGVRNVVSLLRDVRRADRSVDLHRLMTEMGLADRELKSSMPVGEEIEVTLSLTRWKLFKRVVGRMKVMTVSPTRELLQSRAPEPMSASQVNRLLASLPPSENGAPLTVVLVSTAGFAMDAHELADRDAGRTVLLVEPNDAGGWNVIGPAQSKALTDLFDPEQDADKRRRVREHIEQNRLELTSSGIAADRVATKMQLSPQLVEAELKLYAKANPGLVAKLLDGRMVLFQEGTTPPATAVSRSSGGSEMPLLDRVKALFSRKGEEEKKVAFLSERRTALSQQRDRAYEEMATLEQQEEALKRQFREAAGAITKKRVTSHLLQLRKDLERRQQLLTVLNQQINVVSTHLHNLELVRQGQVAQLPDTEEMTADAVKAEEMLAELEASAELAGTTTVSAGMGMTAEEKALFDELEAEAKGHAEQAAQAPANGATAKTPREPVRPQRVPDPPPLPASAQRDARRGEAEAG